MSEKRLVILKLPPQKTDVYFVLVDRGNPPADEQYFYEEHLCPTDILHRVETIIIDGDSDPHGILEYVRAIKDDRPLPSGPGQGWNPDEYFKRALPEAYEKSMAAPKT